MAYSNVTPPTLPSYDSGANPYYLIQFEYAIGAENWETVRFWCGAAPLTWNGSAVTNAVAFSLYTYGTGSPEWTAWGVMAEAGEMALTPGPTTADTYIRIYTNHDILDGTGAVWLAKGTVTPTEEDKEAEIQIRKKSQLAGIIAAWCAPVRQFPKPTAEPVAFLYGADQIRLPGLPELPYKYAAIEYTESDLILSGGKLARMARLVCSSEPIYMTVMITGSGYSILGDAVYYGFANDEFLWGLSFNLDKPYPPINEWAKIGEAHFDERTDVSYVVGAMLTEWSNHDLYYRASDGTLGNVWCSASEPVPVYE